MDANPYWALAHNVDYLARRQPRWLTDPTLAAIIDQNSMPPRWAESLVGAVRAHRIDPNRSDRAIQALARLGRRELDAFTVLLHALAPSLWVRLGPNVTEEYRNDALGELAFVICDAVANGDLDRQNRLARRLVNRAHNRARRQHRRTSITHTHPHAPETLASLHDQRSVAGRDFPAELAVARADIARFARAVDQWIEAGRLSETAWRRYRDYRLGRALGVNTARGTRPQRLAAHRVAKRLERQIHRHLAGHTA